MTEASFQRLVNLVAVLRSPEGCPWDRAQTIESLAHFVLEEAYEVVDAIEKGDVKALQEEIGDHIFEGVLLAQIASENGLFSVGDSLSMVTEKLVRRHPHVFQEDGRVHDAASKERAPSPDAALNRWNALKAQERSGEEKTRTVIDGIPSALPALLRAFKIGKRVAGEGFDWHQPGDVVDKIEEEVAEVRGVLLTTPHDLARMEEEMGDLLFAIANLSRKLGVEPEAALRKANDKFTKRFNEMERAISASGKAMRDLPLEELEAFWQKAKNTVQSP